MKRRWIAVLAVAATVPALATATAASAQSTALSPVDALKRQFADKHGVKITELKTSETDGRAGLKTQLTGKAQFGESGVVASDTTLKLDLNGLDLDDESADANKPSRTIVVKGAAYRQGGAITDVLPMGKSWLQIADKGTSPIPTTGLVNVFEPNTLKAVLATTASKRRDAIIDGTRTTLHQGTISLSKLYSSSSWFRGVMAKKPAGLSAKLKVSWRLWLGTDQLPRRLMTGWMQQVVGVNSSKSTSISDIRFAGWGDKLEIKAPPSEEVADQGDLDAAEDADNPSVLLPRAPIELPHTDLDTLLPDDLTP
jgi:hypothetical protein